MELAVTVFALMDFALTLIPTTSSAVMFPAVTFPEEQESAEGVVPKITLPVPVASMSPNVPIGIVVVLYLIKKALSSSYVEGPWIVTCAVLTVALAATRATTSMLETSLTSTVPQSV